MVLALDLPARASKLGSHPVILLAHPTAAYDPHLSSVWLQTEPFLQAVSAMSRAVIFFVSSGLDGVLRRKGIAKRV